MNACDHPHGGGRGKSKGNKHPRSVFGWLTKGKRTRRPRDKDGNKMYVWFLAGFCDGADSLREGWSRNDQEDERARTSWASRLGYLSTRLYIWHDMHTLTYHTTRLLARLQSPRHKIPHPLNAASTFIAASTSRALHKRPERADGRFIRMSLRRVNLPTEAQHVPPKNDRRDSPCTSSLSNP
jgi:hypothetical protein